MKPAAPVTSARMGWSEGGIVMVSLGKSGAVRLLCPDALGFDTLLTEHVTLRALNQLKRDRFKVKKWLVRVVRSLSRSRA